jgi:hypothetical protein
MSENAPPGKAGEQTLQVDLNGGHNGEVLFFGAWTKASWLELGTASSPGSGPLQQFYINSSGNWTHFDISAAVGGVPIAGDPTSYESSPGFGIMA